MDKFLTDPLRGKIGSAGYFHDFFSGLLAMNDAANIQSIPKDLPLHFISGTADPVGGKGGKGIVQTCRAYQQVGLQDVSYKLYEGARHELAERDEQRGSGARHNRVDFCSFGISLIGIKILSLPDFSRKRRNQVGFFSM